MYICMYKKFILNTQVFIYFRVRSRKCTPIILNGVSPILAQFNMEPEHALGFRN